VYGYLPEGIIKGKIPASADGKNRQGGIRTEQKQALKGKEDKMSKVAVVYWSGTGNTEAMADAVAEGAREKGAEVSVFTASDFSSGKVPEFDAIAFGCPAMGDEVLEDSEFDPMFSETEAALSGKKIALFGSYGWGDGQWMREWEDRCNAAGANLVCDGVMANNAPSDDALEECRNLGAALV
jgi:flavodoxin short chain